MPKDRVRQRTASAVLARIDNDTFGNLLNQGTAPPAQAVARLQELDREWDHDRVLETEASLMALSGLVLGAAVDRKFFALPGLVASMVFLHATTGFYPLLPIFRRLGIRSQKEIQRERYALKALRGDFDQVTGATQNGAMKS